MEMNSKYTVVNCDFVNLRNQPSLVSEIIDKIPYGSEVSIDEEYFNKYFYKVDYNNKSGYCVKTFINKVE